MRRFFFPLLFLAVSSACLGAVGSQRSIKDIPAAEESLRRAVNPKFFKSLQTSPIKGWVVVRGQLAGTRLTGNRIVRSDMGGAYDALALELAGNLHIFGDSNGATQQGGPRHVRLHLLLYEIADGRLAVSFAHFDDPGGTQWRYYGGAWMAVQKTDDSWVTIEPLRLARHEQRGPRKYSLGVEQPGLRGGSFLPDVSWHGRSAR